jgi:hypothetical protein
MYSKCCKNGKIKIPPYEEPPQFLSMLINNKDSTISKHFYQKYDNIIASSLLHQGGGGDIDNNINRGQGPYVF